jgi:DnaJ-domain-containing protein 1
MADSFVLLGQPRRPWLDPDKLKARYLELSGEVHPDRFHSASQEQQQAATARHSELNAAYQRLRDPKERLLHLIELEHGRRPQEIQNVPPETMELFVQVGQLCRAVDAFLAERATAPSPMLKAKGFEEALDWTDRLQKMQDTLASQRAALEGRLKMLDAAWNAPSASESRAPGSLPWGELEQLYRRFSFLSRWIGQLHERIVQLSL